MDKILLVGINAKFIHSNLALRYIRRYCEAKGLKQDMELLEYSINQDVDHILGEIAGHDPKVVVFSCYLWNIEMVYRISSTLKAIHPDVAIVLGGPEVSYTGKAEMERNNCVDYIIQGEGEEVARQLFDFLLGDGEMPRQGLVFRGEEGILRQHTGEGLDMDEIPFPYEEDLYGLDNRILYYETSRGCPFRCQYCLSSIEKGVRFRSLELVRRELQFFLDHNVRQVKFVDRTFNAKVRHALAIMEYVIEHDNGKTNFHFEVAPELMTDEFAECLGKARAGLFQLEIGVQSTHIPTLEVIKRKNHLPKIEEAVMKVRALGNTHMHLDLIAGLPKEGYSRFAESFNYVYHLKPDQLQLGFLKVLKGSGIMAMKEKYGIIYREYPPYEVLKTDDIAFHELKKLKMIEEMVELFVNSGLFQMSMDAWVNEFDTPFEAFETLADAWVGQGMHRIKHQKLQLYDFIHQLRPGTKSLLMMDYCLNEKPKKTLEWMDFGFIGSSLQRLILDSLQDRGIWMDESERFTTKQLSRIYHMDRVDVEGLPEYLRKSQSIDISSEAYAGTYMVVNYNRRDFIHNNGETVLVRIGKEASQ